MLFQVKICVKDNTSTVLQLVISVNLSQTMCFYKTIIISKGTDTAITLGKTIQRNTPQKYISANFSK